MSAELLAYPFLCIAIFFEVFTLVTFLSAPAREARRRTPRASNYPSVAIIVPCLNEESTVQRTIESLLNLVYPKDKLSIVLVDNGSTDRTPLVMAEFKDHPQITLLHESVRGKHNAVNAGVRATTAALVGCLDADSFVEKEALLHIIPCFENPRVAAATAAMAVEAPRNMLEHMQSAEYAFGIAWRHILSTVNGLYVTPGPFSFYRREVLAKLGGFRHGYQTEDMEMALRIQRAGYVIENAPKATVRTKAPRTVHALVKQRTRWTTGFLRNVFIEYRDLVGNRSYGALGTIVLPLALLSVGSSVLLFALWVFTSGTHLFEALMLRSGMPLTYAYLPQTYHVDLFYFPRTTFGVLASIAVLGSIGMMYIGRHIARLGGPVIRPLFFYLTLYGLIAPVWYVLATFDTVIGKNRSWR
jgi:cellulose synthase/poly-beta-1,6-N-acetylglucosamine synthase-like glycosyltransferase